MPLELYIINLFAIRDLYMHYERLLIPKSFISAYKTDSYRIGSHKKDNPSSLLEVKDVYLYLGFHFYKNNESQTIKLLSPRKVKDLIYTYVPSCTGNGRLYKSLPIPTYRYYQKSELTLDQIIYFNHKYVKKTKNNNGGEKFREIFKLNDIW